jgi:DNA polymerase III epsilon subunit-like protein
MADESPLILVFDTETTGLPEERKFDDSSSLERWPRIIQLSYILYNPVKMEIVPVTSSQQYGDDIIKLEGLKEGDVIPAESIHGITAEKSLAGISIKDAIDNFINAFNRATSLVAHNIQYDVNVVCSELKRLIQTSSSDSEREKYLDVYNKLMGVSPETAPLIVDTILFSKKPCNLWPYKYIRDGTGVVLLDEHGEKRKEYFKNPRDPKGPNLEEAHIALFRQQPNGQLHNALVDVAVCLRVYMMTEPEYHIDICAPENRNLSNDEICRIINPGEPAPYKIPKQMPQRGTKRGGRRTRDRKTKTIKTKRRKTKRRKTKRRKTKIRK